MTATTVWEATFTPSSLRAYWMGGASILAGGLRICIEGEGSGASPRPIANRSHAVPIRFATIRPYSL